MKMSDTTVFKNKPPILTPLAFLWEKSERSISFLGQLQKLTPYKPSGGVNYTILFPKGVPYDSTKILKWFALTLKLLVIIN